MIFQKRPKKNANLEFHIGNETIDIVHKYSYLRNRTSSTGNFNISLEHLKEKALHTLFSLRKHTNFRKFKPSLACKTFEAVISPILLYNSEIWGGYVKHDFKAWDNTPIEKTHLKFCKRYLEISNKASNVASRCELGRFSLIIKIYKNILYYILYLLRKNEDAIVKQAFPTSLELHCNGKNGFYHNLMKISEHYDLPDFDPNNLSEAKIKHYIDIIKKIYFTYWPHTIYHSKKLQFSPAYLNMVIKFQVI